MTFKYVYLKKKMIIFLWIVQKVLVIYAKKKKKMLYALIFFYYKNIQKLFYIIKIISMDYILNTSYRHNKQHNRYLTYIFNAST